MDTAANQPRKSVSMPARVIVTAITFLLGVGLVIGSITLVDLFRDGDSSAAATQTWQRFEDPNLGYSIEYPRLGRVELSDGFATITNRYVGCLECEPGPLSVFSFAMRPGTVDPLGETSAVKVGVEGYEGYLSTDAETGRNVLVTFSANGEAWSIRATFTEAASANNPAFAQFQSMLSSVRIL